MCEALIFVGDRVSDDPYKDCKLFKKGDILAVQVDGWQWGKEELAHADFRILKLPNVTLAAAQAFIAGETNSDPGNPSRMLKPRKLCFDRQNVNLPAAIRSWFQDDTRSVQAFTSNITGAQLLNFIVTKPATQDPNVL